MTYIETVLWRSLRKIYGKMTGFQKSAVIVEETDPLKASDAIYTLLDSKRPCMIARFGATEMACILNYLSIRQGKPLLKKYLRGDVSDWWWNKNVMNQMQNWSGFFPPDIEHLSRFCEMMLQDASLLDICGSFETVQRGLHILRPYMCNPLFIPLSFFDPFVTSRPWSRVLKGKKVVVIHPFAELIEAQYARRSDLFDNKDVLPDFELRTVKAVQSLGGDNQGFKDWSDALEWMKREIGKADFDICLIGCGAYGFPLAAHVKKIGKQAVHFGGGLQLMFGIKGIRWKNPQIALDVGLPEDCYLKYFSNPAWVSPDAYRTVHSDKVENNCYW